MPSIVVWIQGSPTFPYLSSEACWVNAPTKNILYEEKGGGETIGFLPTLVELGLFRGFPNVPRAFSQTTPDGKTSLYKAISYLPGETSKEHPLVLFCPPPPVTLGTSGSDIIRLHVKCLSGKTITVDVGSLCTIEDVKIKIQEKDGVPHDMQTLISGERLVDFCLLSDYKIVNDSILHLVLNLRGGMMHRSSGVVDPTNPLVCTCDAAFPAPLRESGKFIHTCGIQKSIIATNTFCGACSKFNCGVAGHTI